ncbi:MAG: hypothetical protein RIS99_1041 [Bacteroidota bacterium]|jgi:hypothetical protein
MMFWVLGVSAQTADSSRVDSLAVVDSLVTMDSVQQEKVQDTLLEPTYWDSKEKRTEVKAVRIPPGDRTGYFVWALLSLLLGVIGYWLNEVYFNKIGYSLINVRFAEEFFRDYKKRLSVGLLNLDLSWVIGFSIWIDYFLISRGIEFPMVALVGIVGGVYWMKRQWIWILGKVTRMDDTGEYYLFSLFNYFRWIAPLLGVLSLFLVFFNQEKWMNWGGIRLEEMIFWAIPFFWAISFVFRLFRVLFRFTSKGVGVFLRFLFYFCVLEIIPTLVLIKWFWR